MMRPGRMALTANQRRALDLAGDGLNMSEVGRRLGMDRATARYLLLAARRVASAAAQADAWQAAGWPPQTPIEALPLRTCTVTPLAAGGVATLAELRALAAEDAELNAGRKVRVSVIPHLGEGGLAEIDRVLALVSAGRAAA